MLTIKSADAKAHRTRDVQLNPILKGIVTEMQDRFHMLMDEYGQKPRHIINRYGKEFKKACRQLGIKGKTLHNLRDTYAVRRWAITGDIKMVADEIGNTIISHDFISQEDDISYGRNPDGSQMWEHFINPTPGFSNSNLVNIKDNLNVPNAFSLK